MKKISISLLLVILIVAQAVQTNPAWAKVSGPFTSRIPSLGTGTRNTLYELPMTALEAVSADLGRDDTSYHISGGSEGCQARNAAQGLAIDFKRGTVHFRAGESLWGLKLEGIGHGKYIGLPEAKMVGKANRLEYDRGPVKEWYQNGPLGLEQGFTVSTRVSGTGNSLLVLGLSMSGDLKPLVDQDQRGLSLIKSDGSKVLRYGGLRAYDAAGKELVTWLEVSGSRLWVKVKDKRAAYPITIDPLVQQANLTASDGAAYDYFGCSVALSADGKTALIGARTKIINGNTGQGAAYVFTRSGSTWLQAQELTASDGGHNDTFGNSVALSLDGNNALIGAKGKKAAYVFTRSGSAWLQAQKLTAFDEADSTHYLFGSSVAFSGDSNTALIGAVGQLFYGRLAWAGAAYVFTRSGSTWLQAQKLIASNGGYNNCFGNSVTLCMDGNTALIGALGGYFDGFNAKGAAYVFTRSGGVWSQQELIASDVMVGDYFGSSVALSSDGMTALITGQGAAYVFTRSGSTWLQAQKLTASDGAAYDSFGNSSALSSDGKTALIGANGKKAAYVFTRSGSAWLQAQKLTATDGAAYDSFGNSSALSSDGKTALIGAEGKTINGNTHQGAAYVFDWTTAKANEFPAILMLLLN